MKKIKVVKKEDSPAVKDLDSLLNEMSEEVNNQSDYTKTTITPSIDEKEGRFQNLECMAQTADLRIKELLNMNSEIWKYIAAYNSIRKTESAIIERRLKTLEEYIDKLNTLPWYKVCTKKQRATLYSIIDKHNIEDCIEKIKNKSSDKEKIEKK